MSAPGPAGRPDDPDARLEAVLARATATADRLRAHAAAQPADTALLQALAEAASGPDGSPRLVSLVERGRTTWAQVWADPPAHGPEAARLVSAAVVAVVGGHGLP